MLELNFSLWVFDVPQTAGGGGTLISAIFFPSKMSSAVTKGDILLVSDHVVELLTKMYQAVLDATQRQLSVTVTEK